MRFLRPAARFALLSLLASAGGADALTSPPTRTNARSSLLRRHGSRIGLTPPPPSPHQTAAAPLRASVSSSGGAASGRVRGFLDKNFFLLGMAAAVSLARLSPALGARPAVASAFGKFGVAFVFLISGLGLRASDLSAAISNVRLNGIVQTSSFVLWPLLMIPLTTALRSGHALPPTIIDGLTILSCLPTTINMCVVLTSKAGGNVAAALCNAVFGNMAGIFVTPALLLHFFGTSIDLPFGDMVRKLAVKVVLPVAVGQALRATRAKEFYADHSKGFKRAQDIVLLGIMWNAFSNAFTRGFGLTGRDLGVLLTILPILHAASVGALYAFLRSILKMPTKDAIAGAFCGGHKTLAVGLPLIGTVFEGHPDLAAFCAPIMLTHPMQMVLGSLMGPRFVALVEKNKDGDGKGAVGGNA